MPGYRPTRPPENRSKLHAMMAATWDMLWGGKFPFIDTDTVKVHRGPNGYAFTAFPPSAGVGGKGKTLDANYKMMSITNLGSALSPSNPDLLICSSVNMASGSPAIGLDTVYVAKARTMRRIGSEIFFDNGANSTQTYSYFTATSSDSTYGDNFRQASDGVQTELEVVVPRYYNSGSLNPPISKEQSFIFVVDLGYPTGVVDPNGTAVTKVEVIPARMWSKVVNA